MVKRKQLPDQGKTYKVMLTTIKNKIYILKYSSRHLADTLLPSCLISRSSDLQTSDFQTSGFQTSDFRFHLSSAAVHHSTGA